MMAPKELLKRLLLNSWLVLIMLATLVFPHDRLIAFTLLVFASVVLNENFR